jgi:hypothetical protein
MIFQNEKEVILFFHENESECKVYRTWNRLKDRREFFLRFFKRPKRMYYLLEKSGFCYPKLKDSQKEKLAFIRSMVVFGRKDEDYPLLRSTCGDTISHGWFGDKINKPVSVILISKGAQIFTDRKWDNIFGHWISFGGKFSLLEDLDVARREADIIFPGIINLAATEKNVLKLKEGIIALFDKSIFKLSTLNRPTTSDERMTVQLLKLNRDNLVSSLDKEYSRV